MSPEATLVGVPSEETTGVLAYSASVELAGTASEELAGSLGIADIEVELAGTLSEELTGRLIPSVDVVLVGVPSEEVPGGLIVNAPGGVAAEHMDPQDATGLNLWLLDESIETTKIAQLVADKIVGGTISTTDIFVASTLELLSGGALVAGPGTTLTEAGLALQEANSFDYTAVAASYKVSSAGEFAGIWFFDQVDPTGSGAQYRGVVIRADGNVMGSPGVGLPGEIFLCATSGGVRSSAYSAVVEIVGGKAGVFNSGVYVRDILNAWSRLRGVVNPAAVTLANGASQSWSHTLGVVPLTVTVQISTDSGVTWRPVTHSATWGIATTSTNVTVTNSSGASAQVRLMIIG